MMLWWAVVFLTTSYTSGHLIQHPQSDSQTTSQDETSQKGKTVVKRHAQGASPFWGFIPFYSAPPVIQIHHIIHVQSPNPQCFPIIPPPPMTTTTAPESNTTKGNGVESRLGGEEQARKPPVSEPSPCIWAIVSCCSPGSKNIRYSCFELLGCTGAFWDRSPCEARVVQAAANSALMYYMSAQPINPPSNVLELNQPESNSAL